MRGHHLAAMRIVCPTCSAAYEVPDSLVAPGRMVHCARCGTEWVPVANAVVTEPQVEPEPAPEPPPLASPPEPEVPEPPSEVRRSAMDRLAAHPAMPRRPTALRLAWAGSIILLILLAAVAFAWRSQIVAAWPPSARAYAAFGLRPQTDTGH
jgi:predicted Zn finger-like uncharacterized protein